SLAPMVRRRSHRGSANSDRGGSCSQTHRRTAGSADGHHRARTDAGWLSVRGMDWTDDRRLDRGAVRRSLSQPSRAETSSPTQVLGATAAQAAGQSRPGATGNVAAQHPACNQKKARQCRGVVAFGDEASFWLDGTLHQTWARIGCQPRVDTFGMRKTAHVFGIVTLEQRPEFAYQFAPVFNGATVLHFLHK